ncbi:hypothetical protein [Leptospira santarosai]|uniref:hypothetical protein n=1 Tax=Leptospira santarosai TaxID=28183 RepID=UPI00029771D1|nr:hypothetical protein [Leptospira santarosai]EKS08860.1 hypothetical protein LEP1GSC071_4156 [Leptospira santarosai str. JET]
MITQYKIEHWKRSLYLSQRIDDKNSLRTDKQIEDRLLTRCALMEEFLRERSALDQFHEWRRDQEVGDEAYSQ